jgi:hypothetical protein
MSMEHEHLNEKSVALYIKAGKMTGRVLAQAMREFLKKAREPTPPKHGSQSIKSLTKQGSKPYEHRDFGREHRRFQENGAEI